MATKGMRQIVESDLAEARRQGKTYNKFYSDEREKQYKSGMLSKKAYDQGRAYELATPKEVRNIVDNFPPVNSMQQYQNEREAGDPNALRLSFEDWKKL